ncbi:MAG: tRNA pseudouridine(55) synthase TruB [Gammaproteobacteria bacterium]|nr:tRNA pseudouridine(55) synthase TruB [Gammaproteobacteria bacterium]
MGRRKRKGQPVHGWLIVDKPTGMTSTAVVNTVKRLTDAAKAGHGGTLDPLATGILPVAFGEATKTMQYVVDGIKTYRFTLRWGAETDTDDADGTVVKTNDSRPDEAAVRAVLPDFIGEIEQVPPRYSAIKVNGQRAYDRARDGEEFELEPRQVWIEGLDLVDMSEPDHAVFEVSCGAGTYMRSLARDIARAVGAAGHIADLRRTRVGPFAEENSISLDELRSFGHSAAVLEHLLPVETALDDIPALALTDSEASRLRNGQTVSLLRKMDLDRIADFNDGDTVLAVGRGKPIALTRYAGGEVHPLRVLNL